eukprot:7694328-Alexandrium_andersonii.AAC.1
MSASLVGSEMCIRDRPLPSFSERQAAYNDTAPILHANSSNARARRAGSVSYTHLTLPTICSV